MATIVVDEPWLLRVCGRNPSDICPHQAYAAAAEMGPLARWWLRSEVLDAARAYYGKLHNGKSAAGESYRPAAEVSQEQGACWVLLARQSEWLGLLRPAFVLPLRWQRPGKHHRHLPAKLCQVADQVIEQVRQEDLFPSGSGAGRPDQWGLVPGEAGLLSQHDLSQLDWAFDSAWAPLAAGLLSAAWEAHPDRKVWASGAFSPGTGPQRVEGLQAKLAEATRFGASVLYVPEQQVQEVRSALAEHKGCPTPEIAGLADQPKLAKSLQEYLGRVGIPPGANAPEERRREWFLKIADDTLARRYYYESILADVRQRAPAEMQVTHLVTIVSKGFSLVDLAWAVARPQQCLLLHDAEMAEEAEKIRQRLACAGQAPPCRFSLEQFRHKEYKTLVCEFRTLIATFLANQSPERLLIDLTGGKKVMTLALYDAAPRGSHALCCEAELDEKSRRPKPFTERFHVWPVSGGSRA